MEKKIWINSFRDDTSFHFLSSSSIKDKVLPKIDFTLSSKKNEKFSLEEEKSFINFSFPKEVNDNDESINIFDLAIKNNPLFKITSPITSIFHISKSLSRTEKKEIKSKDKKDLIEKIRFTTLLYHKRGRKTSLGKKVKYVHKAHDFDNILRKIQVKYLSFLINLANDVVISIFGENTKYIFKNIDYRIKTMINHSYIENIKKYSYSDLLQMKISTQYKFLNQDLNKQTYLEICENCPFLKKFFSKNYLDIFIKYYHNEEKPLKEIFIGNEKIKLSSKTKNFYYLLENNKNIKEILKKVVKTVYLRSAKGFTHVKHKPFIINEDESSKEI